MKPFYTSDDAVIFNGDCRQVLATLDANCVDTVITDPPYGLEFMGKGWDKGVPGVDFWVEVLRVAKPGAMLLAFGGSRTYHRLAVAIEDAGWEMRDCLMWLYGTGFPKSHNISKSIDKRLGAEREPDDYTGANFKNKVFSKGMGGGHTTKRGAAGSPEGEAWDGWGTALKPAWEPIILAMKPLDGTFANNALEHGVAGLNIDASRIGTDKIKVSGKGSFPAWRKENQGGFTAHEEGTNTEHTGRWPANVLLDEDAAAMLGDPSRFFYCAKAGRKERGDNIHPTVKPIALMRWLARLTSTPTHGLVLDPFMGSGSTGVACLREGRQFVGVELSGEYAGIASKRLEGEK